MTTTYKNEVEEFFNSKISVHNIMYNFFNSNISEFAVNLQGTLHEVKYKTFIQNMHKLGWKANYFKPDDVSMLVHGCGVSQNPQFMKN